MLALFLPLVASSALGGSDPWKRSIDKVTNAVVAIEMDRPRAFDGRGSSTSQATGFVIDSKKGLILTNRHVVSPGPSTARARFLNKEEVDLTPVYRDPVHDFGLYRYDPAQLRHFKPTELTLAPERVRVGLEIRVVGNDSGDQLQILDGTLARIDRNAPNYGPAYNDFNTFYIQAGSSTSGGSSGSPVVDIDGRVVALNAGSRRDTASAYYLPLPRVVRAVERLNRNQPITRGTLQVRFLHRTYDELRDLGLTEASETAARKRDPRGTGLLVAVDVLPLGPADERLEPGDILLEAMGKPLSTFVPLEAILDAQVGKRIPLVVERRGKRLELDITVGDLHAITPDRFLEVGGSVLHALSYHQARAMQAPVAGISVAGTGYMFDDAGIPRHAVLIELDGKPLTSLDDLDAQLAAKRHGDAFRFRYYVRGRPQATWIRSGRMNRRWFTQRLCARNDTGGTWDCAESEVPEAEASVTAIDTKLPPVEDKLARKVRPSLVQVRTRLPYQVGGVPNASYGGLAVLVGPGLAVTDRDTVPIGLADVTIEVANTARLPAEVVAIHPIHNLAVLAFDPSLVPSAELKPIALRSTPFEPGDRVFGMTLDDTRIVSEEASVRLEKPLWINEAGAPRFRQTGLDVLELSADMSTPGVVVDKKGRLGALWASFSYTDGRNTRATWQALPVHAVQEAVELATGRTTERNLPWEIWPWSLAEAVERGLPNAQAQRLADADPERRTTMQVRRVMSGSALAKQVRPGDIVVAIDGTLVTRFRQVDDALRGKDAVTLDLMRGSEALQVTVETQVPASLDIDRVLLWSGLRIHQPHRAARMRGVETDCPYASWYSSGSPAVRGGLYARHCIAAVDGKPTPNVDALVEVVKSIPDGQPVRVDLRSIDAERRVRTLTMDRSYWPTVELRRTDDGWRRIPLD
ncbi:MAG: trypsin-like peptidase domain-containing protein [Myxococcota bacterium]